MFVKRILLIVFFILMFSPADAEEFKIAVVRSDALLPYDEVIGGFRAELQGHNVKIISVGDTDTPTRLAAKISAIQPAVVLCLGTKALESVSHIKNIPKIFCLITLSKTYAFAGRQNVYGVVIDIPHITQFKIIKTAFPKVKRIGVVYNPEHNQKLVGEAEKSARAMGLHLIATQVRSIKEIPSALQTLEDKVDLLWAIYDQTVYGPDTAKYILLFALKKNIPFVGFSPQFAKAGALLSLYGDHRDMGRQAALIALKIVNGEIPSPKRTEPRKTRIAINEKVAKALEISLPDYFLKTADKIY